MLTEIIFGQRWGLIEQGKATAVVDYVNRNWQRYLVLGLFPRLAQTVKKLSRAGLGSMGQSLKRLRSTPDGLEESALPSVIPVSFETYEART